MRLPAEFVAAMRGDLPPVTSDIPSVPKVPARKWLTEKNVPEPSAEEIARVDAAIRSEREARWQSKFQNWRNEGVYLSRETYRKLIAETNDALWHEVND